MTKEEVLKDISALMGDIDKCENELLRSKSEGDTKMFLKTLYEIERLLVSAHQELSFLYDHIKALYGLMQKADEVYFRAGNLSADMNSSEVLRKAREDYWHYVNYELYKEGGKDESRK